MAVNKVILDDEILMDTSEMTVTEETLIEGHTALNAAGEPITGTNPYEKTATDAEVTAQAELIAKLKAAIAAAAGGSGGVETCTVEYQDEGMGVVLVYLSYVDGEYLPVVLDYPCMDGRVTLENVVKNSIISLFIGDFSAVTMCEGATLVRVESGSYIAFYVYDDAYIEWS